jgi:hypothetical protein
MAAAAVDVNKTITGDKAAPIRNYNTQPHLSLLYNLFFEQFFSQFTKLLLELTVRWSF